MHIFSTRQIAFAAALTLSALGVETASAAPLVLEHYSGTDTFSFDNCGFEIDGTTTFTGLFMLKEGRGGDPTPYLSDNYSYETVFTNPETEAWFTTAGNGLYKDLRITHVEGSLYRFEAIEVGRPFEVRDSDGNVVLRDHGRLHIGFTVDTLGDDNLDNDVFIDGTWEVLADNGAHPGFYIDFCDIATDLIG